MTVLKKGICVLGMLYGALYIWGLLAEIGGIAVKDEDFVEIYQMDSEALHWQFKSFSNLLVYDLLILVFMFLYVCLNYLSMKLLSQY
jgi:uncharacterized membrane protein